MGKQILRNRDRAVDIESARLFPAKRVINKGPCESIVATTYYKVPRQIIPVFFYFLVWELRSCRNEGSPKQ
jgi:hypothetical protein